MAWMADLPAQLAQVTGSATFAFQSSSNKLCVVQSRLILLLAIGLDSCSPGCKEPEHV